MEAVTWLLLLLSLFVAAWFVVRGSGIPTKAGYEVALGSLEVPAGAPPAPPGGSPRGDRDGPANDAGALRAESTGAMQLLRLGASDIPGIEREVGRDAFVAHCAKLRAGQGRFNVAST